MSLQLLLILGLYLQLSISRATDDLEVTLSTGRVQGQKILSVDNNTYYSFTGIPYAAPPVGYLRFKAPQLPESWDGVLKAINNPPACSQPIRTQSYAEKYNEDCLYLNVYTSDLKQQGGVLMPVMVWIHGGMQFTGSSTIYKYGPDFLCSQNIILVTFNYRLGMFGYLNTNSKSAQGNAAAKDKIAVLKWIQKEIIQFGGDRDSVTIFGDSSGGQDVNCLYISPMAKGLFHKAISHSAPPCGTSYNPFTYNPAMRLAENLGCPTTDPEVAVACLRTVPAQVIADKQVEVINPGFSNMMVIEKYYGEETFMPDSPEKLLKNSKSELPYMMGMNSAEGILNVQNSKDIPSQLSYFEKNFERFLPSSIQKVSRKTMDIIVATLKKFYFGDIPITSNIKGFINFMTDRQFAYYVTEEAKSISSHAVVYLYYFTFQGDFQPHRSWTTQYNVSGVSHGDEQGYMFFRNHVIPEQNHLTAYPQEYLTLQRMVRLWTNFAKYRDPTPDKGDELLNITWLPVSTTVTRHIVIDKTLLMNSEDLLAESMDVWKTIFDWVQADSGSQSSGESTTAGINIVSYVLGLTLIALLYLVYDSSFNNGYRPIK